MVLTRDFKSKDRHKSCKRSNVKWDESRPQSDLTDIQDYPNSPVETCLRNFWRSRSANSRL